MCSNYVIYPAHSLSVHHLYWQCPCSIHPNWPCPVITLPFFPTYSQYNISPVNVQSVHHLSCAMSSQYTNLSHPHPIWTLYLLAIIVSSEYIVHQLCYLHRVNTSPDLPKSSQYTIPYHANIQLVHNLFYPCSVSLKKRQTTCQHHTCYLTVTGTIIKLKVPEKLLCRCLCSVHGLLPYFWNQ